MPGHKFHGHGPDSEGSLSVVVVRGSLTEGSSPLLPTGKPRRMILGDRCKLITYRLFASLALLFVVVNLYTHFVNCPLRKREEEELQKLNMFWGSVEAHTCTTYATREYTAQLMNLPATWVNQVEACKATPLEVHGISYLPKSCEDKGHGVVMGRWEIGQHEPDCNSYWTQYKVQGCISHESGKRRIEHYLENLPEGGDWREFCATTPARFHRMEFSGSQECYQFRYGTYGLWEIDDITC
ncbi:hypothetical protein OG21DRAFT_136998 [Imleria badia]|nr:hypothetical protein OG21DRAFT_136998 [Imleria badia]